MAQSDIARKHFRVYFPWCDVIFMRPNLTVRRAERQPPNGKWQMNAEAFRMEIILKNRKNELTDTGNRTHNYAVGCIIFKHMGLNTQKRFRQGQILKLITSEPISSQDELRKRLSHVKVRVTQATLSRDMSELKLVKTTAGYKPLSNGDEASAPLPPLGRALRDFLVDLRPAYNMLVLKTPPSGAQPLAAALDAEKFKEVAGTIAGDDTVLVITPSRQARAAVQKRMEDLLR